MLIRGTRTQAWRIFNIIFCGLRFVGENTNKGKKKDSDQKSEGGYFYVVFK